ncbi:thiamine phosphate synthase [Halogeometricum sp. S1BR25-6]|uniref:Thiamine-phosphate synthase n=1 Tax=Halogeometricum salsisoli TaxID=2950536 RepID=A0ABU2GKP6_9EURY|nr:thiamine phosphate synthase [Halogeometricum sp. S1BR25-6]MDS0300853.1 thiamine phosphate synthase [Halogeometricum sp. S1BR25-6]
MRTYLVTQADRSRGRGTVATVRAALAGGVDVVQMREKHATARERYELGRELRALTREAGVAFVVNDRVDVAAAVDADGVHLGDDDLPIAVAREQLCPDAVVGRSVSTVEGAVAAERAGADYLGVGAVFATDTKDVSDDESNVGTDRVTAIADAVEIPIVGIGGITAANAAEVVGAGADGVAVVSAITDADDPEAAARDLRRAVDGVRTGRVER